MSDRIPAAPAEDTVIAEVPTLDLADAASDDPARLDRAADAVLRGLGGPGAVMVAGHGVAPDVLEACHTAFLAVTARPEASKRAWLRPDLWYQRGWTPPDTERAVAAGGRPDFKECWFAAPLPPDPAARDAWPELHAPNVWPDDGGALEAAVTATGRALHEVGRAVLRAAERALGLDGGTFDALLDGAAHVTRVLRYLPVDEAAIAAGVLWGEEHTDFNLLTVLGGGRFLDPDGRPGPAPDDHGGLYLRTPPDAAHPDGRLLRGVAPPGHLVAQTGQALEILTAGRFLATPHVIRTPRMPGWSRTSIAHFLHVHADRELRALPPFADGTGRAPVLAGVHAVRTLVDIGLAPPSALDALAARTAGGAAGA